MDEVVSLTASEREELEIQLSERTEEAGPLIRALLTPALNSPTALDRRRLGLPPEHYEELVDPLGEGLLRALWDRPGDIEAVWGEMAQGLYAMADVARDADLRGLPAATAAQVTAVVPFGGGDATSDTPGSPTGAGKLAVHLEAPMAVDYLPGQSLPVLVPGPYGEKGEWRELTPALPSNPFGQLVFYVPDWWRWPEIGEYWTCGSARGQQLVLPDYGTVDATGDRLAGVRAAVFGEFGVFGEQGGVDKRIELAVDVPELALVALAGAVEWLIVRQV